MKIQEFLYQISRLAGDADHNSLSTDMLLIYMTEESAAVASLFPRQESFETTVVDNSAVGSDADWIDPQFVYMDNVQCQKMFSTEVERMIVDATLNLTTTIFWALTNGTMRLTTNGSIKIVGNWKPVEYLRLYLDYEMTSGVTLDTDEKEVPALTGERLRALRYRMLARCAEELSAFDKAQYYVAMGERIERDLRNTINLESTVSTGFMYGTDF